MSKISVQANVVMEFGETLVLSGLSEKETQKTRDGVPLLQSIPLIQYLFSKKEQLDFHRSVLILITPRPRLNVYVNTAAEKDAGNSAVINELQARYSDWFKPYPNLSSVFHHMQSNSLYREFRTGDVSMEHWDTQQTLKDALRQAAQFLYY
jgi:type II secretory pathway component GspD/PulD (secretin)